MLGEGGSCAREGGSSAGKGDSSSWGGPQPLLFNFLALKKPVTTPNNINNRSAFALSVKLIESCLICYPSCCGNFMQYPQNSQKFWTLSP